MVARRIHCRCRTVLTNDVYDLSKEEVTWAGPNAALQAVRRSGGDGLHLRAGGALQRRLRRVPEAACSRAAAP